MSDIPPYIAGHQAGPGSDREENAAVSVNVRCGCGQVVVADDGYRGQVVQCPFCKAGVAVPVAAAGRPVVAPADKQAAAVAELLLGLVLAAVGYFFFWDSPFGKFLVAGGAFTAFDAGRRF